MSLVALQRLTRSITDIELEIVDVFVETPGGGLFQIVKLSVYELGKYSVPRFLDQDSIPRSFQTLSMQSERRTTQLRQRLTLES